MKSAESSVVSQIWKAFPPVSRPPDSELTVHGDECAYCFCLVEDLNDLRGDTFGADQARRLIGDLLLLSPSGFRWAIPSYLAAIFTDNANLDLGEFLAYHCCGKLSADEEAQREARIAPLSCTQIDCLIMVLLEVRSMLGSIYYDSVDEAVSFLSVRRK